MGGEIRNLNSLENIGYSMAGIYAYMVKFVLNVSKFPVKIALRDAEPIYTVAQEIIKNNTFNLGGDSIEKLKQWQTVYLNRPIMDLFKEHSKNAIKYFEQEGINKPFTYVDTGFQGSISRLLFSENIGVQTVFMISEDSRVLPKPYNVLAEEELYGGLCSYYKKHRGSCYGEWNEKSVAARTFEDFLVSMCGNIFEKVPNKYFKPLNFKTEGSVVVPCLNEKPPEKIYEYKAFNSGLKSGLLNMSDINIGAGEKYLNKFLESYNAIKGVLAYGMQNYNDELDSLAKDMNKIYTGI